MLFSWLSFQSYLALAWRQPRKRGKHNNPREVEEITDARIVSYNAAKYDRRNQNNSTVCIPEKKGKSIERRHRKHIPR